MKSQPLSLICYLSLLLLPLVAQSYQTHYDNLSSDQEPTHETSNTEEPSSMYAPPTDIDFVRLNDTSVVVKWEMSHTSNAVLQFFKIQYKSTKKDQTNWKTDNHEIPPSTRAHQVDGLRPGNYFFIVIAVYDNDDNVASDQIKFRLRASSKIREDEMPEMKAPVIVWHEAKQDYIRFKWRYTPRDRDVPYYGYLVYYRSAHVVSDFTIYNTLDESVELADLEYDTPYEAKVVAYNQVAVSEFSSLVTVKTNSSSSSAKPTTSKPPYTISTTPNPTIHSTVAVASSTIIPVATTTITTTSTTTKRPSLTTTVRPPDNFTISKTPFFQEIIDNLSEAARHLSDTSLITILILLPILIIVSILIGVLSCRHSSSKPSSQISDTKFDLEIGYFTNSFPGVEKIHSEDISNEIFRT